jgi:hypothetical protein
MVKVVPFKVVGTVPETVKELAKILATPLPTVSPEEPELMMILPNLVVAPMSSLKVTVPVPGVRVKFSVLLVLPSIVDGKEIFPVVVITLDPVNRTGDTVEIVKEEAVMLDPMLTAFARVLALAIVKAPRAVVPPTAPVKVIVPDPAFKVSA